MAANIGGPINERPGDGGPINERPGDLLDIY